MRATPNSNRWKKRLQWIVFQLRFDVTIQLGSTYFLKNTQIEAIGQVLHVGLHASYLKQEKDVLLRATPVGIATEIISALNFHIMFFKSVEIAPPKIMPCVTWVEE